MADIRAVVGWAIAGAVALVLVGVLWQTGLIVPAATLVVVAAAVYGAYYLLEK